MLCHLKEVKATFTVCLLQFMYDILFKENVSDYILLSVNLEKACVTVLNMYHGTKNTGLDEIKGAYSISHASC